MKLTIRIMVLRACLLAVSILYPIGITQANSEIPLNLPPGFQATLYANNEQVPNLYCITTTENGDILASGPGYLRILQDRNQDGLAESVIDYSSEIPAGAQGMYVDGTTTYCVTQGGIFKFVDEDHNGITDDSPELLVKLSAQGEHGIHAIRKGPDGFWYVITGNNFDANSVLSPSDPSPVQLPKAGVLLRYSNDFSQVQVVSDGIRNAYDFDFHTSGDLFTYDSDGERDISLPWYRPTRMFHVVPGLEHGWKSRSWKTPAYFPRMNPVLAELGRGSPTGVVIYRHHQFPKEFRNAAFLLDWTYGRVIAVRMTRKGASWTAQTKNFITAQGDYGFAPTDAVVGKDGALYLSIGGRGTRGSIFRITYQAEKQPDQVHNNSSPLDQVLKAPQPLSAWSRAVWEPQARELGEEKFLMAALNANLAVPQRVRAIEILVDLFEGPDFDMTSELAFDSSRQVRCSAVWSYGLIAQGQPAPELLSPYLRDPSPIVVRRALEVLLITEQERLGDYQQELVQCLNHQDYVIRELAVQVASRMNDKHFMAMSELARDLGWASAVQVARAFIERGYVQHPYAWKSIGMEAINSGANSQLFISNVMMMQASLRGNQAYQGKVFDGYLPTTPLPVGEDYQSLSDQLSRIYPTGQRLLDWELVRLMALIRAPSPVLLEKVLQQITPDSHPISDIHHLIVTACLTAHRTPEQTEHIATALLQLNEKLDARGALLDRNWDDRILEAYRELVKHDENLTTVLIQQESFGRTEHTLYVKEANHDLKELATSRFLERLADTENSLELTPEILSIFAESHHPQAWDQIRSALNDDSLKPTAIILLAKHGESLDRHAILEGLKMPQHEVVSACLQYYLHHDAALEPVEVVQLIADLPKIHHLPHNEQLLQQVFQLLSDNTGASIALLDVDNNTLPDEELTHSWFNWAQDTYPELWEKTGNGVAEDHQKLITQLESLPWDQGSISHGQQLFRTKSCAQCHGQRGAVGPSLQGVTNRFSRQDLFISILDPHRDVSPRYQTTMIVTQDGKTHVGIIVYESIDGLILRDSLSRTIRIESKNIEFRKKLISSLMPNGLLKGFKPQDYVDLYAYLKSLNQSGRHDDQVSKSSNSARFPTDSGNSQSE